MTIYLALLRGINVGGNKKIKMSDLKAMLEEMGLGRVKTYIQSGNVIFDSEDQAETLQTKIEEEINRVFGFQVSVTLRTAKEVQSVIENCPFSPDSLSEGESVHVSFLTTIPTQEEIEKLPDLSHEIDEYRIVGREIYFLLRQSILDSKLPAKLQKLGAPQTMRNWNTTSKLATMVATMEG